jgi:hypothetical protein
MYFEVMYIQQQQQQHVLINGHVYANGITTSLYLTYMEIETSMVHKTVVCLEDMW